MESLPERPAAVEVGTRAAHVPRHASEPARAPTVPVRSAASSPPTLLDPDSASPGEGGQEPEARAVAPAPFRGPGDRREPARHALRRVSGTLRTDVPAWSERRIGRARPPASLVVAAAPAQDDAAGQRPSMMGDPEAPMRSDRAVPFRPRTTAATPAIRPAAGVAPSEPADPADPEALVEALADDLDRAASALGIGPGRV